MIGIRNWKHVAIDSNVFVYHFEDHPELSSFTVRLFEELSKDTLKATTSVISLIEVLSFPLNSKLAKTITEVFYEIPNLDIVEINADIGMTAARIRREYGFRLPDAVQLATAKFAAAPFFVTNDRKLKKYKEVKVILLEEV